MLLNDSWPAVSQICNLRAWPLTSTLRTPNSTPIVTSCRSLNVEPGSVNCSKRQDLPTPVSPITMYLSR